MRDYLNELIYPPVIVEGMKYSIFNGGKRLRPVLLLMVLEALEEDTNLGLTSAAAIEMIHSYSLVHDDLPALDNDEYRRGKLTTHKNFGEAEAILIGDALLTHAFLILSSKNNKLTSDKIVEIIRKTAIASGVSGMIGGQMVDIEYENKKVDLPTLQYIHTHKTGKLLKLPVEIALIISEIKGKKRDILLEYADLIGLAFQIKDDILDVEGDFKKLGKKIGSDQELEKSTYVSLLGLEQSKKILTEKIKKAKDIIKKEFGGKGKYLIKLADFIEERER
ncbi:MAG: geranyl transferase [Fusobacteriia bacterium 4572_132]|nr:MAG: geranyl transferase [Fusobacteriia bacterium 4572_132]